jgi:hypothetical protein
MTKRERSAWAQRVEQQLLRVLPDQGEVIFLAGIRYREELSRCLRTRGFKVTVPLEGLGMGMQLQRLKEFSNGDRR